jgi:hypothetical protein
MEADGSVLAWPLALALAPVLAPVLAVLAVPWPLLLAAGAEELAEDEPAGTPGIAAEPDADPDPDPEEPEVPVDDGELEAPAEAGDAGVDEAAATPGMAAIASATWVSSWDVAWVPVEFCGLVAAGEDCDEDDGALAADPLLLVLRLVAGVVDAGRLPLSTKPCTPSALREPEYSCALTDKLGSESPPIVDSTPPE